MNELASKLFKTFFRSKKSFLSSENELVEVASKIDILEDFHAPKSPNPMLLCERLCKPVVIQSSFSKIQENLCSLIRKTYWEFDFYIWYTIGLSYFCYAKKNIFS